MTITKLTRFCNACRDVRHDRCGAWLGELFGFPHRDCPCGCRDDSGQLTYWAYVELARRNPDTAAHMLVVSEAFRRGSWDLHMRMNGWRARSPRRGGGSP